MKSSVIVFPGSNCDRDIAIALEKMQFKNKMIWHKETKLPSSDLIVIPGGFSYGDYLRSGAIAGKSLIINEVIKGVIAKHIRDIARRIKCAIMSWIELVIKIDIFIPNIIIGKKVGSIKIDNSKFPPFSPKVKAAPIVEIKLSAGVDINITSDINIDCLNVRPNGVQIIGIKIIIGKLVVIQCVNAFKKIIVSKEAADNM